MFRTALRLFAEHALESWSASPDDAIHADAGQKASDVERLLAIRDLQLGAVREALGRSRSGNEPLATSITKLKGSLDETVLTLSLIRAGCVHHWKPTGEGSRIVCELCLEVRPKAEAG